MHGNWNKVKGVKSGTRKKNSFILIKMQLQ